MRYYPGIQAWKNKLGLPNPGIQYFADNYIRLMPPDKIVSISARNTFDWIYLLNKVGSYRPAAIELNVSCPNCPNEVDVSYYPEVFKVAREIELAYLESGLAVVVKLPPVNYEERVATAAEAGLSAFHACNTLSTPGGGLSGKPLKPLSLAAIRWLRRTEPRRFTIIGGGGIACVRDCIDYLDAGADHLAIASTLFNPFNWRWWRQTASLLDTVGNINSLRNFKEESSCPTPPKNS